MNSKKDIWDWIEKCNIPYKVYRNFPKPEYLHARCTPFILDTRNIKEISWENGMMTATYEVGRMNENNLRILAKHLRDNDYNLLCASNDMIFKMEVVRLQFNSPQIKIRKELPSFLGINVEDCFFVGDMMVFIRARAFVKFYDKCGKLKLKKPFDLMDYEFEQRFTTLNPICCQLRKNGIAVDTVDIWDDYLMIKSDCIHHSLTAHNIAKALNINGIVVRQVIANKLYVVEKWK